MSHKFSKDYTPGPWIAEQCQDGFVHVVSRDDMWDIATLGPQDVSAHMANGQLMASAPDLLEALEFALPSLGFEEAEKARAAIAKARGNALPS